jgi:hypothetical protein
VNAINLHQDENADMKFNIAHGSGWWHFWQIRIMRGSSASSSVLHFTLRPVITWAVDDPNCNNFYACFPSVNDILLPTMKASITYNSFSDFINTVSVLTDPLMISN